LKDLNTVLNNAMGSQVFAGISAGVWNQDTLQNISISKDPCYNSVLNFIEKNNTHVEEKDHFKIDPNKFSCFLAHGLHPMNVHENWLNEGGTEDVTQIGKDISLFHEILSDNRNYIWAIGETGFDLSNEVMQNNKCKGISKAQLFELQNIAFETCIHSALKYELPVILHLRAPWDLCLQKIKWAKKLGLKNIMIHCYSGPAQDMKIMSDLSIYCSFGGVPTWEKAVNNRNAFLKCHPHFRMLETDSPDLPPEIPGIGKLKINEPANLKQIIKILAPYLNISEPELIKTSNENILKFLGIL
jgi:TatD DNase family protein